MSKKEEQPDRLKQFISWVDGDREPKDRTLFVMEQRPHREFRPSEEEFERREKDRLRKFFNWYPIAAAVICVALGIILFAIYVLLNGETSPGGGFSGGTILGAGLILFSAAFGPGHTRVLMNQRRYSAVRTFGLLLYAVLYGVYIFIGANGLPNYLTGMILLIDLAVGLVVACTVYGFYALFSRGEI